MKSYFEQMGGTYRKVGDYYIPNLALPTVSEYQLGKYGRMRRSYLKDHHPACYTTLVLSGKLFEDLETVDKCCDERMDNLCKARRHNRILESIRSDGVGVPYEQHP